MADIYALAADAMREKGAADAATLAARTVSGEAGDAELLAKRPMIPTWQARDFSSVPVGTPYQWQGVVYKLRQQHDAAANESWTPDQTPALWAAVSGAGEAGTLEAPITAARGMEYTYGLYYLDPEDSTVYLCSRASETDGGRVALQYLPHELTGQYFTEASA